jgi:uncharacterized C2H2 Zn-finger protein
MATLGRADYVSQELTPTLTKGLTELCRVKPQNPVEWLGDWLIENKPFSSPKAPAAPVEEAPQPSVTSRPLFLDPETGNEYIPEEGEEIKRCLRCSRTYVTLSGKTLCLTCRKEFMAVVGEIDEDAGEELRGCERCHKAFLTTSGKKLCVSCRKEFIAVGEEVDEEAGEELRGCAHCQKAFITTSGKTLCMTCRKVA